MRRSLMLIIAACLALAIAGCGGGDDDSTTEADAEGDTPAKSADASAEAGKKPKVEVPSGPPPKQLEETELIEGDGAEAKAGDEVSVHYVGVLYDNGKQFDASWDRGEPFSFTLGNGEVIAGWDQGVEGMKVGGRRELVIPPELGYGPTGVGPIPAEATLVFVVDLLSVK